MDRKANGSEKPAAGWRLKLGAALFVLSILLPLAGVAYFTWTARRLLLNAD